MNEQQNTQSAIGILTGMRNAREDDGTAVHRFSERWALDRAIDALSGAAAQQPTDIGRLRVVIDRIDPEALARAGIFPLAGDSDSDDELRAYVDRMKDTTTLRSANPVLNAPHDCDSGHEFAPGLAAIVSQPAPATGDEMNEDALTDLIAGHLSLTYHCTRVWNAWNVGTMSQDDFEPVDESDTPREIARAILASAAHRREDKRDFIIRVAGPAGYERFERFTASTLEDACEVAHKQGFAWVADEDGNPIVRTSEPAAWHDVLAERVRQITHKGWTPEHDDEHNAGEMAQAAACYAYPYITAIVGLNAWPWTIEWFKPGDPRRNLVKAGALILAEIERIDRTAAPAHGENGGLEQGDV